MRFAFRASARPATFAIATTRLVTAGVAGLLLAACAGRVNVKPETSFLGAGLYRALPHGAGAGANYRLELMSSGRFTLRTYDGGCQVGEETGRWTSDQEHLTLDVRDTRGRDGCAAPWIAVARTERFTCPLRQVSGRSFQMLHDEIAQGTVWTEWSRDGLPAVAAPVDEAPRGENVAKAGRTAPEADVSEFR